MCINWLVEVNAIEIAPFTCTLVQASASSKYNLNCEQGGVCFDEKK